MIKIDEIEVDRRYGGQLKLYLFYWVLKKYQKYFDIRLIYMFYLHFFIYLWIFYGYSWSYIGSCLGY